MCALFGIIDHKNQWSKKQKDKMIRALSKASEVRGTDATGIAYCLKNRIIINKTAKPAHKCHFYIPQTPVILGHTRMTTQGSEKHNYNNHPFRGFAERSFALAHNGVIWNDGELRLSHRLPQTKIQTDSYIIVQMIERYGLDQLPYVAEQLMGSFTITLLDNSGAWTCIKGDNPMYICRIGEVYIYASTKAIVEQAFAEFGIVADEVVDIQSGEILTILPDGMTREVFGFTHSQAQYWDDDIWDDPYITDESYDELRSMSSYFGYEPKDVDTLIDHGCTYDEIVDYLYYGGNIV